MAAGPLREGIWEAWDKDRWSGRTGIRLGTQNGRLGHLPTIIIFCARIAKVVACVQQPVKVKLSTLVSRQCFAGPTFVVFSSDEVAPSELGFVPNSVIDQSHSSM